MSGEILTQLQDQLDAISRKFYEGVGVLQRDAPPVSTSGEAVIAPTPAPGFVVSEHVQRMSREIIEQVKATEALLHMLPDQLGGSGSHSSSSQDEAHGSTAAPLCGPAAAAAAESFSREARVLQLENQAVSKELASAVSDVEGLLLQLQQLYAALAQEKLRARAAS